MSLWTDINSHLVTGSVPVVLGSAGAVFDSISFQGVRVDGATSNTSTVTVSPITPISGVAAVTVLAGLTGTLIAPTGTTLTAAQFEVNSATSLDGVVASYYRESTVDWNLLESKVEEACELLVRTIPSVVGDCTISRGLDVDTKTANSVICSCSSATIRGLGQKPFGNYDCKVRVKITSQSDDTSTVTLAEKLVKHWQRVSRVRDAFLDEYAITFLTRSVALFYVFDSVRDFDSTTVTDERSYVTELGFTLLCVGSDIG